MTVLTTNVSPSTLNRLRTLWWAIHRWIAVLLCVLLVPIAISGALLVWHDELEPLLHPARFAVTGNSTAPISSYLDSAQGALPVNFTPIAVRFPAEEGRPITVMARGEEAGTRQLLTVYLDPPNARVLDVVNIRSSFFGFLHRFKGAGHHFIVLDIGTVKSIRAEGGDGVLHYFLCRISEPITGAPEDDLQVLAPGAFDTDAL